jgi:hypothetical protein
MVSLGWAGLDPAHIWDENSSLGLSIPYTTMGRVFRPSQRGHEQYQSAAADGGPFIGFDTLGSCRPPLLSFGVRPGRRKDKYNFTQLSKLGRG